MGYDRVFSQVNFVIFIVSRIIMIGFRILSINFNYSLFSKLKYIVAISLTYKRKIL